ncbi:MAG: KH domain-containing protein [Acidimicrobiales bacterium]
MTGLGGDDPSAGADELDAGRMGSGHLRGGEVGEGLDDLAEDAGDYLEEPRPEDMGLGVADLENGFEEEELGEDLDDEDLDDEDLDDDELTGGQAADDDMAGNRVLGGQARSVLEYIARALVDDPDAVVVEIESDPRSRGQGSIVLKLHVAPPDMGKVIGKRGRVAQAIRTVVGVAGSREEAKVSVDIVD